VVRTVDDPSSQNVWNDCGLVRTDLTNKIIMARSEKKGNLLTVGRKMIKPTTCEIKNSLYDCWRTRLVDVSIITFKQANATKLQAMSGCLALTIKVPSNPH